MKLLLRWPCRMACARRNMSNDSQAMNFELQSFAEKKQTGVSLRTLLDTGKGNLLPKNFLGAYDVSPRQKALVQVAGFLHRELPIRLAHRVFDLDAIPILRDTSSVQLVKGWYVKSFQELRECPAPTTPEREEHFSQVIQKIYERHAPTLLTMAKGVHQARKTIGNEKLYAMPEIHEFLDRFYLSRIGIRVLIGHYLALREPPEEDLIGLISPHTSPATVALSAIDDATYMCNRERGQSPPVTIHGRTDLAFPYVPSHMHYILLELLKNSMRATVEYHSSKGATDFPPIRVVIADGEKNEDVVIKVSDEGGGIARSMMPKIWSYLFTTADPDIQKAFVEDSSPDHSTSSPLAGLGYGLPIARLYARYFGGDMKVVSMEGYGTDAFVYLSRLGTNDEPLP